MMSTNLCQQSRKILAGCIVFAFAALLSGQAMADDSTCITCHTDLELLEDNLKEDTAKKSAMQAGSG
jgi:hypothetical protein